MKASRSTQVGLAARLGGWSAEHRKKAIFGWIALLVVAVAVGNVGAKKLSAAGELAARDVIAAITATHRVKDIRSPFDAGNSGQISRDGRSALVLFSMKGER